MKITIRGSNVEIDPGNRDPRPTNRPAVSWRSVVLMGILTTTTAPVLGAVAYGYATGDFNLLQTLITNVSDVLKLTTALLKKLG